MINSDKLIHGIGDYISARFEKYNIDSIIDKTTNTFNFWYPKDTNVGYKISFYLDEQKKVHFSMRVSDPDGICNGIKACIEENAKSNREIGKTHYLSKKEVSEQKVGTGSAIEVKCNIKTIPNPKRENDEKTFYNILWAYIVQPTMRGVWESMQKYECSRKEQAKKCA